MILFFFSEDAISHGFRIQGAYSECDRHTDEQTKDNLLSAIGFYRQYFLEKGDLTVLVPQWHPEEEVATVHHLQEEEARQEQ